MNKKQIVVVIAIIAIMGYLYSLPVKGLIKPSASHNTPPASAAAQRPPATNATVAMVSEPAKAAIGAALAARINDLESQLKDASDDVTRLKLEKQLATQWDDDNQPAPAAFYYLELARKENAFSDWLNAGNRFNDAVKLTQDTAV